MFHKQNIITFVIALALLFVGGAFTTSVQAVTTGSDSSEVFQSYKADWVNQIDQELQMPQLRWTFLYDPGNRRSAFLSTLNQAAEAMEQQSPEKAKELVRQAFTILEEGNRLGYYPANQVDAVKEAVKRHLPNNLG